CSGPTGPCTRTRRGTTPAPLREPSAPVAGFRCGKRRVMARIVQSGGMLAFVLESFPQQLRRWGAGQAQALRVLLTLGSLIAVCGARGRMEAGTPLFLGAIASALAKTDDSARGRYRAQVVTLLCFAGAA